jgi:hypothetical protein
MVLHEYLLGKIQLPKQRGRRLILASEWMPLGGVNGGWRVLR